MGLGVCFGSRNIFSTMLDHLEVIFEKNSKSQNSTWKTFLSCKQTFNCQNAFFLHIASSKQNFSWVLGTNHCIQRHFGSIPKASRARFLILSLLFEKMNFFHSQASTCSKIGFKVHILHVKNHFVGWKNSNFSNSFRMFLDDVEWVWECPLGLEASFSRCYTI